MNENKYTIYDISTGEIKRTVTTRFDPALQLDAGEAYVTGSIPDESRGIQFYVKDNRFYERVVPPSDHHVWRNERWIDPRTSDQILQYTARQVRKTRNEKIARTDWTQLPDVPITTKEAWAEYRQQLRDVSEQAGFPMNVTWPEPPSN